MRIISRDLDDRYLLYDCSDEPESLHILIFSDFLCKHARCKVDFTFFIKSSQTGIEMCNREFSGNSAPRADQFS